VTPAEWNSINTIAGDAWETQGLDALQSPSAHSDPRDVAEIESLSRNLADCSRSNARQARN
jgi:hypothetical protein